MNSERLEEKWQIHVNNKKNDMHLHFDMLKSISRDSNIVVELGIREVVSTWALMAGLANRPERFITVNPERNKLVEHGFHFLKSYDIVHPAEYGIDIEEIKDIARENGVEWEFFHIDTLKTEIPLCDTIFFDTDHTYEQLSQELKLHAGKAGKFLAFHDTSRYGGELIPAINEFLEENTEWHILHCENLCQGLTVLIKASLVDIEKAGIQKHDRLPNE